MFQSVLANRPKKSKFDLSYEHKLSCNMGDLVPIYLSEIVPGDKFRVSSEIMMRLAPMLAPVMHRVNVWVHYFFVPNRIIWNEWEDFITGGEDGLQAPVHPYVTASALKVSSRMSLGSLADYFGLPRIPDATTVTADAQINWLPFRAYGEIYNEYYRDQNLTAKLNFSKASGESNADVSVLTLRKRCWEKDYYTSALPWAQRGAPVTIPGDAVYSQTSRVLDPTGTPLALGSTLGTHESIAGNLAGDPAFSDNYLNNARIENLDEIGIDINDLRTSNALQKWLELAARGGSRYIEQMRSFFGVTSSDARLQRPEYLGGGKQNVVISEVLQTSQTDPAVSPQGNMAGHGVSVGATNRFSKRFEEHGYVMGIMSVLPKTAYQNGMEKFWFRNEKTEYYFPQFAHLGEQEIKTREVYYDGVEADIDSTWGYQSRFAEYKYATSKVSGDFRANLNYWHMGRIFTGLPPLNSSFVQSDPTHRIFANTDPADDKLWVQVYNKVDALRPMPYYGIPKL